MSWSLSSLGTYEKCPAQYKYKYIDRIPTTVQSPAAARGVEMHGAIEMFLAGKTTELPHDLTFYHQFLTQIREKYKLYPEHTIVLNRQWEHVPTDSMDRWYKGILDLKAIEGPEATEATVIDWKTGKIYPEHEDQKSIYSIAVSAEHPTVQRVRAIHVYLDLGKNRETTFDRQQLHQLRSAWDSRVLKLEEEKEFLPNPTFKCRFCPYSKEKGGPCRF